MSVPNKNPLLIWIPPAILLAVGVLEVAPWLSSQTYQGVAGILITVPSAFIWLVVLWWALHHLTFQFSSLFSGKLVPTAPASTHPVRIAIMCPTRDDFSSACCATCLKQDSDRAETVVIVCDDADTLVGRQAVDRFCAEHPEVKLFRRSERGGFKAGNLNEAFRQEVDGRWDWALIVDADQQLPAAFVHELAPLLAAQPPGVAFVQAGRMPLPDAGVDGTVCNPFQAALQSEMLLFYERDLHKRPAFGFMSFLGHGGAIRADAWRNVGGLPTVVSEDFAFSMRLLQYEMWGERIDSIRSAEGFPVDFSAFVIRLSKFAAGAGEIWTRLLPRFLASRGRWVEKWDAVFLLATHALAPLILINLFVSAILCHLYWNDAVAVMPPRLLYLFIAMFFLSLAVLLSITPSSGRSLRHWFWAVSVYGAALPILAGRFLVSLVVRPRFSTTPKIAGAARIPPTTCLAVSAIGLSGLIVAGVFWSPFSPILAAPALSQSCVPIFVWLHEDSVRGMVARFLIYFPGLLFSIGLTRMWFWASS